MTRIEVSRRIDASPGTVWDVVTDIPSADRTLSGVLAVEVLTPGPYAPGFRWRETRKMFGVRATEEMTVSEADAPHSTVVTARHGGTRYTSGFVLSPTGTDTELTMHFESETGHASLAENLARMAFGWLGTAASRRMMSADLDDIAAEAERRS